MTMKLYGDLWLGRDDASVMGDLRISILEAIDATGSITQAAKSVGVSYKTAWDALDAMKNISGEPLVESASGGRHGGGSRLTAAGRKLVATYRLFQQEHQRFLSRISEGMDDSDYQLVKRLSMKSSARNQFFGKVTRVQDGQVSCEVEIALNGEDRIVAVITHDSQESLKLKAGSEVWALIKASWVILGEDDRNARHSARNRLCGTVSRLTRGGVNSDVVLTLGGGNTVSAIVTSDSIEQMGLKEGVKACALFQASSVILCIAT